MKKILTSLILLSTMSSIDLMAQSDFMVGADVSYLKEVEDSGGTFSDSGVTQDALDIFRNNGFNWIRLKIWHTPDLPYNDLPRVREMAVRAKSLGFKLLLNFHYSDTWADPGHQDIPAAWVDLDINDLVDSLYAYTDHVIADLKEGGAMPDMVQIGNETNCGMLWPMGNVCGSNDNTQHWSQLGRLMQAGIDAVHANLSPGDSVLIMVHHAGGGNNSAVRWFLGKLFNEISGVDVIGLSYYSKWQGALSNLSTNLNDLANRFPQKLVVVETAYPWTMNWADGQGNIWGPDDLLDGYPASVSGQSDYLMDLRQILASTPQDKGIGIFYWEPEWISAPDLTSAWENATLFDFTGAALSSISALANDPSQIPHVNVTLRMNTSTNWDTIQPDHFAQVRGEIDGCSGNTLEDGRRITWDAQSDLVMDNVGGDYWSITLPLCPGDILSYKFWTGTDRDHGSFVRLGWEGPIVPAGGVPGNTRIVEVGAQDTTIDVEFYNGSGASAAQFWRPFEIREDTIAIYFRVNMSAWMASGHYDPDTDGALQVLGSEPLSWTESRLILDREIYSVNGGSFWSGTLYLPRLLLDGGFQQDYKFAFEGSTGGVQEVGSVRSFGLSENFTASDTTLHWDYFSPGAPAGIVRDAASLPAGSRITACYPNPFNGETLIQYQLTGYGQAALRVYDLTGRQCAKLVTSGVNPGEYRTLWTGLGERGEPLPTGVYFIQLTQGASIHTQKIAMVK